MPPFNNHIIIITFFFTFVTTFCYCYICFTNYLVIKVSFTITLTYYIKNNILYNEKVVKIMDCTKLSSRKTNEILENNSIGTLQVVTPNNEPYVVPVIYAYYNDCDESEFYVPIDEDNNTLMCSINNNNSVALTVSECRSCNSRIYGRQVTCSYATAYGNADIITNCPDSSAILNFIRSYSPENERYLARYFCNSNIALVRICPKRIVGKKIIF